MKVHKVFFLLFTFSFITLQTFNSSAQNKAKVRDTSLLKYHSPTKATIMSAILPGLGQAYNHKYWKIPIIYAGAATIIYFAKFNNKYYQDYKTAYSNSVNGLPDKYPQLTSDQLQQSMDYYQKDLQLTYIIAAGIYLINILDAAVDANLFDYDITDKLTLRASPIYYPSYDKNLNFALGLTFKLKIL